MVQRRRPTVEHTCELISRQREYIMQRLKHIEADTNGRNFLDEIFKYIFLDENVLISTKISLKFVPKGQINNIPALV